MGFLMQMVRNHQEQMMNELSPLLMRKVKNGEKIRFYLLDGDSYVPETLCQRTSLRCFRKMGHLYPERTEELLNVVLGGVKFNL